MKKGLLNLLLLVLVITNVALTAILVFAIVPAMNATSDLVAKVAAAIDLEKELKDQQSDTISIDKMDTFTFADKMLVQLKSEESGKQNMYAQFSVTITMNKDDENYSKYKDKLTEKEKFMRTEIDRVIGSFTAAELQAEGGKDKAAIAVRDALRKIFNETEFIYSVGFSDLVIMAG